MQVDTRKLETTDDAWVWAYEFSKVCPNVNVGLMLSWFANLACTAERIAREKYDPVYNANLSKYGIESKYIGDL